MLNASVLALSAKEFGSIWAPLRFVDDHGAGLTRLSDTAEFDFWHDSTGARIELKSARARNGVLIFQYVRPACFDVCVCLGVVNNHWRYWLFDANKILPFLSKQHRASDSFQLRIPRVASNAMKRCEISPEELRGRLDAIGHRSVRRRKPIRLDPVLATVEGWPAVARSMTRQAVECGLSSWTFVFRLLKKPPDPDESDLLPYPLFNSAERRIEFYVRPEPILGRANIWATAASFFGFLIQYLDEDIDATDLESGQPV